MVGASLAALSVAVVGQSAFMILTWRLQLPWIVAI
jgi:hypothetical protein